jgi:hypothetical protein
MRHTYSSRFKLSSLFALTLGLGFSLGAFAQSPTPISIGSATAVYTQNFDAIGATGVTYPAGWTGLRLAGSGVANETLPPAVTDGSANAGGVYNVGTTGATDRAFGTLGSTSTEPAIGAVFTNGTGAAITRVNIAARAEQWRSGSNNTVNEVVAFEYSLNATSLSTGTWTAVTALDLNERATTTTTAAAIDGNLAANNAAISGSITLNWPANTTMWIRWKDVDNTGSDALLAVDNFAISTGTTPLATRNAAANSAISVFPNPANDVVSIRINGKATNAPITVSDLTGRKVLSGTVAADGTFSLRSLPAGSYVVSVQDGAASATYKIVKQ